LAQVVFWLLSSVTSKAVRNSAVQGTDHEQLFPNLVRAGLPTTLNQV
jgi:hypothetical protein